MKKIMYIVLGIVCMTFAIKVCIDWYTGIENNIYHDKERKAAERQGFVGSAFGEPATATTSGSSVPPSPQAGAANPSILPLVLPSSAGVALTTHPGVVVCTRDIDAFNPSNPPQILGKFRKGTVLAVVAKDAASGKISVAYRQPDGKVIRALCRPLDIGL